MAKTPKERGKIVIAIEFDTKVMKRLRADAKADQRSVGYLVRQIVNLHYAEIDDPRNAHLIPPPGRPYRGVLFPREDTNIGDVASEEERPLDSGQRRDQEKS